MKNYLLSKGYKYFVRLSGSGVPVLGSMVARRVPPRRSNGDWADITSCLQGCCALSFSVNNTEILLNEASGNMLDLLDADSTYQNPTFTFTTITIPGVITINADGTYEIEPEFIGAFDIVMSDQYGNTKVIKVNVDTTTTP